MYTLYTMLNHLKLQLFIFLYNTLSFVGRMCTREEKKRLKLKWTHCHSICLVYSVFVSIKTIPTKSRYIYFISCHVIHILTNQMEKASTYAWYLLPPLDLQTYGKVLCEQFVQNTFLWHKHRHTHTMYMYGHDSWAWAVNT